MNEAQGHRYFEKILQIAHPLKGIKLGLDRLRNILPKLGSPQESFKSILIGGTNGKGSTAAMLAHMLSASGKRCGLYTSPHFQCYEERFNVDGQIATAAELDSCFDQLLGIIGRQKGGGKVALPLTYFEITTLICFLHFLKKGVEVAVLEVGVGGRLDATNVVDPELCALLTISLDHQHLLGNSTTEIAREKLGITRSGVPLVSSVNDEGARKQIRQHCNEHGVLLDELGKDFHVEGVGETSFSYFGDRRLENLELYLSGRHQWRNAGVALRSAELLDKRKIDINWEAASAALSQVSWPGRMELIESEPQILLDCCHNAEGAQALARHLESFPQDRKKVLLFAASSTKDVASILKPLVRHFERIVVSQYSWDKGMEAETVAQIASTLHSRVESDKDPAAALKRATACLSGDDLLVAAGSLYFVAEVRELLGQPASAKDK